MVVHSCDCSSCSCYRPLFLSLPLLSSLLLSLCWPLVLSLLSPLLSPLSLSLLSLHCCRGVCTYSLRQQKRHLDFCRVYPTQTSVGDHDLQFGGYAYLIYRSQTRNGEVSWSVGMFNKFFLWDSTKQTNDQARKVSDLVGFPRPCDPAPRRRPMEVLNPLVMWSLTPRRAVAWGPWRHWPRP